MPDHQESREAQWLSGFASDVTQSLRQDRRRESLWGWIRIGTFLVAAIIWIPLRANPAIALGGSAVFVIGFAAAVTRHRVAKATRQATENLRLITSEAIERCGGKVVALRNNKPPETDAEVKGSQLPTLDDGPTCPMTEQEREDLDYCAEPTGIYGLLNRCSCVWGERRLQELMQNLPTSATHIAARQESIRWLAKHHERRLRLMAAAAGLRKQDAALDSMIKAVRSTGPLTNNSLCLLLQLWAIPSAVLSMMMAVLISIGRYEWTASLAIMWTINALCFLKIHRRLRAIISPWKTLVPAVEGLAIVADAMARFLPDSGELGVLRRAGADAAKPEVLKSLRNRIAWGDSGGMMHALCNVVFFYDLHVAKAITNCVLRYRPQIISASGASADLEAFAGLACFAFEQPLTCWPRFEEREQLSIVSGLHPLIDSSEAIPNDVLLNADCRTWVVSGSNMAGKSTFLRMIGVNTVLAQIGTTPTATDMTLQPHQLITDLRIRDDLAKHESYFLAEVRQLRRMVSHNGRKARLLGLVDEPFRGTNSQERVAAGIAVVKHLMDSSGFFVIATHEKTLCDLTEGNAAVCYHFHEELHQSGPTFDYRLKPGAATRRNALLILAREGYPEAIVQTARAMCSD